MQMSIQSFNDGGFGIMGGMHRIKKNYGYYKGNKFANKLEEIIYAKTKIHHTTFFQLDSLQQTNATFKKLYVVVTNLTQQKSQVLSAENYPNMQIAEAVRLSMSIPIYFAALWVNANGSVHAKPISATDELMVDGGLINNFPIEIFDSTKFQSHTTPNSYVKNFETLGLLIEKYYQLPNDKNNFLQITPYEIYDFKTYIKALYNTNMEYHNRAKLNAMDKKRIVFISDKDISPKIKKMSNATKNLLIQSGKDAVLQFLKENE